MKQLKITSSITSRESRALEKYLQEIGKMEMLTPEEEVALARRIKQGDEKAMEELKPLCIANGWRKVDFSYFHRKEVKTTTYAYFPYEPKEAEAITDK